VARTNPETIRQRAELLQELLPGVRSIGELCCGDCAEQWSVYRGLPGLEIYLGLDIDPEMVRLNRERGIHCRHGDVMDRDVLAGFLDFDVLFFGPPLSAGSDGHTSLSFREVVPGYGDFVTILFGELEYHGTCVCICPKGTTMGDISWLYGHAREGRPDFGLRLIHYSYASVTGRGEGTDPRLKYVEVWLSSRLEDAWEVRRSRTERSLMSANLH
jgi:hypothetical protein